MCTKCPTVWKGCFSLKTKTEPKKRFSGNLIYGCSILTAFQSVKYSDNFKKQVIED